MKTIKILLLTAALAVSAAAMATDSSYILYWNLSEAVKDPFSTLSSGTYYAAIGVSGAGDGVYLKNEAGGTYQIAELTAASGSDSGYTVTYPNTSGTSGYIAGYVTGTAEAVGSYNYYLAILDSTYTEITTLSATSYSGSTLLDNGSLMAYNQSSSGTPTKIAGFTAAVPEPTSGLLMLLGLAGLALRRPSSRKRYAVTGKRA